MSTITSPCCHTELKRDKIESVLLGSVTNYCIRCKKRWTDSILYDTLGKDSADLILKRQSELIAQVQYLRQQLNDKVRAVLLEEGLISTDDSTKNLEDIRSDNTTVNRLISNFICNIEGAENNNDSECELFDSMDDNARDCRWLSTEHRELEYKSFTKYCNDTGYTEYSLCDEEDSDTVPVPYRHIDRQLYDRLLEKILGTGIHTRCWMCRYVIVVPDGCTAINCDDCKANLPVQCMLSLYDYDGDEPWYYD